MKREYDFTEAKRGAVLPVSEGKTRVTICLDDEVLAWFCRQVERRGGGSYQAAIEEVLRQHIASNVSGARATGRLRRSPRRR